MTTFSFDKTIPAANNNPSADQPLMLINNDSTDGILAVDHVSFLTENGGTHKKITYIDKIAAPALPAVSAGVPSIAYTGAGVANTATAQNYFKNNQGNFPLSCVRAFGSFSIVLVNGAVVPIHSFNVDSITSSSAGAVYTIAITPNAFNGTNVVVLANTRIAGFSSSVGQISYAITGANTLEITYVFQLGGTEIDFVIIQI